MISIHDFNLRFRSFEFSKFISMDQYYQFLSSHLNLDKVFWCTTGRYIQSSLLIFLFFWKKLGKIKIICTWFYKAKQILYININIYTMYHIIDIHIIYTYKHSVFVSGNARDFLANFFISFLFVIIVIIFLVDFNYSYFINNMAYCFMVSFTDYLRYKMISSENAVNEGRFNNFFIHGKVILHFWENQFFKLISFDQLW